jgi:hypothetical protein
MGMEKLLQYLSMVTYNRQEKKVWHKMNDIIALGNAAHFLLIEAYSGGISKPQNWILIPHVFPLKGTRHQTVRQCLSANTKFFLSAFFGDANHDQEALMDLLLKFCSVPL